MKRGEVVKVIAEKLQQEIVISANGYISREMYNARDRKRNFYMLGSMGLASSIGLGIALNSDKRVVVLDGDGNLLMNLGVLSTVGNMKPKNFVHICMDNELYESTGGQKTNSRSIKLEKVAEAAGYATVGKIDSLNQLDEFWDADGPVFILIKIEPGGGIADRVVHTPVEIRDRIINSL